MGFKKATKKGRKLRLALFGVSGSGKTFSALSMARGLGKTTALIDTENRSACIYADKFNFDVAEIEKASVNNLILQIKEARGYDTLVIDSGSHAWDELLQEVEKIAQAKFKGNTWAAWSEGTPKQQALIKAILDFPGHIIMTMRVDTEWSIDKDNNGKTNITRVGLKPKQGKGIEYEFDMLMQIDEKHNALVLKDRTSKYQDEIITKPDEEFGKELATWLENDEYRQYAEEETGTPKTPTKEEAEEISKEVKAVLDSEKPEPPKESEKTVDIDELEKKVDADLGKAFTTKVKEAGISADDWKDFKKTYGITADPETFQMYLDSAEKLATIVKDFQNMKTC